MNLAIAVPVAGILALIYAAFKASWLSEVKKKKLTVWTMADPPAPGARVTVTLHLPDGQVLALFGRLAERQLNHFSIKLDLPFVTKNKLKRLDA